jgi:hypothetical protein
VSADGLDADAEDDADVEGMPRDPITGRMIWESLKRAPQCADQGNSASSGEGVVQDNPCGGVEGPPMTMREMFPRVGDLGVTPGAAQVRQIPTFLRRISAAGRDSPLDVDDPNATPDGDDSDEEDLAPLIDSEDEDDDRLRNRCCDNYEDDADEDGAEIVVHDGEAREEEEFERLPTDLGA